ncbi:MAG: hypothetical protein ABI887_17865 [Burkholderiales bacterium]
MERIAVFVNDAAHARHLLQPMLGTSGRTHWIVVACPPRLTRHVGRWVSQPVRRAWRERWGGQLLAQLAPDLAEPGGSRIEPLVAHRPLVEVSAGLVARFPGLRLLDARRPILGKPEEPLTAAQPPTGTSPWAETMAAAGSLAAVLSFAD